MESPNNSLLASGMQRHEAGRWHTAVVFPEAVWPSRSPSPSPNARAGQGQTPVVSGLASAGVTNPSPIPSSHSLGPEAHAKAGQVAVGDGEEDHEGDVPGVVREYERQVVTGLHVAQHEKGDEDDTEGHHHWQEAAVLPGLEGKHRSLSSRAVGTPHPMAWWQGLQRLSLLHRGC